MFAHLPHDLIKHIFRIYLEIIPKDIALLDIVVCNHTLRVDFLSLLPQLILEPRRTRGGDQLTEVKQLGCYFNWISSRGLHVPKVVVNVQSVQQVLIDMASPPIHGVQGIQFVDGARKNFQPTHHWESDEDEYVPEYVRVDVIAVLVGHFPSLRTIEFDGCHDLHVNVMHGLVHLQCPLEVLDLGSFGASVTVVTAVVGSLLWGLKEFHAHSVEDATLRKLSRMFQTLKVLDIKYISDIKDARSIEDICLNCAAILEVLELGGKCPSFHRRYESVVKLDSASLSRIAESCRKLKVFSVTELVHIIGCFHKLLANCPAIERVMLGNDSCGRQTGLSAMLTNRKKDGKKVCCLVFKDPLILEVIATISIPIHRVQTYYGSQMTAATLQQLVDRFGADLDHLDVASGNPMSAADCMNLWSRCPNLETLDGTFSDETLSLLPSYCPHVTSLTISDQSQITEAVLLEALRNYASGAGSDFHHLAIGGCKEASYSFLVQLCELMPNLHHLSLTRVQCDQHALSCLVRDRKWPKAHITILEPTTIRHAPQQGRGMGNRRMIPQAVRITHSR